MAVGLWYGQVYVMDNKHRCILLMAFWMYRHTMTRSWGPLLCHSSTTITSCCSMIMHGPMLQGSVLNSWKLKTSQFLHGQHTHRTCHPLSIFGMLWIGVNDSVFPSILAVPANIQQPRTAIEEEWTNIPQATINNLTNSMRRRCVALSEANGGHTRYWLVFWTPPPPPPPRTPSAVNLHILEWPFTVASLRQEKHAVQSASWYATHVVGWMDYLGKGEVLTNTDLDRFGNNIWDK